MYLVDHKNLEKMSAKAQTWKKCLLNRTNLRYIEGAKLGHRDTTETIESGPSMYYRLISE